MKVSRVLEVEITVCLSLLQFFIFFNAYFIRTYHSSKEFCMLIGQKVSICY